MTAQSISSFMGMITSFSKKKSRYLQSRESFYESRNFLSTYSRVSSIVQDTSTNSLTTDKTIKFYGLDFGVSIKKAMEHLGKPNYVSKANTLLRKHKTIFYRISIAQVKCILQLHFVQDQFFLGLIEIRSTEKEVKREVTQLIKQKYGIDQEQWTGAIYDGDKHQIELKNDIVPYIVYKSGDADLKESIRFQLAQNHAKKQKYYDKRSDLLLEMI